MTRFCTLGSLAGLTAAKLTISPHLLLTRWQSNLSKHLLLSASTTKARARSMTSRSTNYSKPISKAQEMMLHRRAGKLMTMRLQVSKMAAQQRPEHWKSSSRRIPRTPRPRSAPSSNSSISSLRSNQAKSCATRNSRAASNTHFGSATSTNQRRSRLARAVAASASLSSS